MNKYCSNCGKELKEGAEVCLNCGVLLNKNTDKTLSSGKVPGNGKSIAGMVLGIIACVWAFFQLLSIGNIELALSEIPRSYINSTSISFVLVSFAFGYTIFSLIPSLVGLPLSISGLFKQKTGKNIAGIILNSLALIISIIAFIYIMTFANYEKEECMNKKCSNREELSKNTSPNKRKGIEVVIIRILCALLCFLFARNNFSSIDENALFSGLEYSSNFIILSSIAIFLFLIPSLIGLKLSITEFNKSKIKINILGIILNSILIIISIVLIQFVYNLGFN